MGEDFLCRICLERGKTGLIAPCLCGGSIKWVHRPCLNRWRETSHLASVQCNACKYLYLLDAKAEFSPLLDRKVVLEVALWVNFLFLVLFFLGQLHAVEWPELMVLGIILILITTPLCLLSSLISLKPPCVQQQVIDRATPEKT